MQRNVHSEYAFIIHLVRLIRIVSQSDRESRTLRDAYTMHICMHMHIYIYICTKSIRNNVFRTGCYNEFQRERIARRSMIQRYTRAIRARSCGIRRIWQRQSAIPCAKLSTHLASHESHPDTLDIGTIVGSIDFNWGVVSRYWSLILSAREENILWRFESCFVGNAVSKEYSTSRNYVSFDILVDFFKFNCCNCKGCFLVCSRIKRESFDKWFERWKL